MYVLLKHLSGITCEKEKVEDSLKEFLSKKRDIVVGNTIISMGEKTRKLSVTAEKSIAHQVCWYIDDMEVPVPVLIDTG